MRYPKAWQLVLMGVLLTITSALINQFVLAQAQDKLAKVHNDIEQSTQTIDKLWRQVIIFDAKKDTAYLLLSQANPHRLTAYIEEVLTNYGLEGSWETDASPDTIYAAFSESISDKRMSLTNKINDVYWTLMSDERSLSAQEGRIRLLAHLSVFLQMIGLILVLAKDLKKED